MPERAIESDSSTDAELVEKICGGDRIAFRKLVDRHSHLFYRIAYRFMRNQADAEDVVQDAFAKLWQRPQMWSPDRGSSFTTWFCRVIINLCLDRHKRKSPLSMTEPVPLETILDQQPNHDDIMVRREREAMLERLISKLPARQKTALNLCFYEGYSNQQAAMVMQVSIKVVQSLVMRAKANLKNELQKTLGDVA